ncbi:hypothetical protein RHGRI_013907 [Rhododendron griersonianum]|uniref:Uncharacterized protein n=1 Tax=Rhododendron griersonianum TaxID=479676 RepID=A0AAV6K7A5_9ERIC|nr:hypothetical protein RHGRI_013907 [Rhododendron griersonianum]
MWFHLEMGLYLLNRARTYLTRKVFDEKGDRRAKERSVLWKKLLRRKDKHLRSHCPTKNPRQGHPSCMGHSMWPNMMPHPMRPNMAQGGSIFPFFPTLCPTATSLNQFMPSFPSSQSLLNGQV